MWYLLTALKFVGVRSKHLLVSSGSLRQSSENVGIFGNCWESFLWPSDNLWRIFGNLWISPKNVCITWSLRNLSSHLEKSFSTLVLQGKFHKFHVISSMCELILTMLLHRLVLLETLVGHQGISGLSVGQWTHIVILYLKELGQLNFDKNLNNMFSNCLCYSRKYP